MRLELPHAELLDGFEINVELLRSRVERRPGKKPAQSTSSFQCSSRFSVASSHFSVASSQ